MYTLRVKTKKGWQYNFTVKGYGQFPQVSVVAYHPDGYYSATRSKDLGEISRDTLDGWFQQYNRAGATFNKDMRTFIA